MALPDVSFTIQDGGLGLTPGSISQIPLIIGTASGGTGAQTAVITPISDLGTLKTIFVSGPLVDACAHVLAVAGGPVYAYRIFDGTIAAGTHVGAGVGTVTPSGSPIAPYGLAGAGGGIVVTITTTGAVGTSQFTYSLDGGNTQSPIFPTVASFVIPNTGVTLAFAGASFTATDTYANPITATLGTFTGVTHVGAGAGVVTLTNSNPVDSFNVIVTITGVTGALGVSSFTYSTDGGRTVSQSIFTAATYSIPLTGIVLNFSAASYTVGDLYTFQTTGPGYTTTDVTNTFTMSIFLSSLLWGYCFLVGKPATSAACATMATTVDALMTTAFNAFRFTWAIIEAPTDTATASIDATLVAAFASFSSLRISVGAGDCALTSNATGWQLSRTAAWPLAARTALTPVSEDAGYVGRGACTGVAALYRDENLTPGLDVGRFSALRTILGQPGFYLGNGRMMAPPTSDFRYTTNRRVMDKVCTIGRPALLPFLNASLRVNPTTGAILEADARNIEQKVGSTLNAAVVAPSDASATSVQVSRTSNILATSVLPVTFAVTPKGYNKQINVTASFVNPAQVVK